MERLRPPVQGVDGTLPGGSCYSVGAGGHVTGGGYGLLSRLHGLRSTTSTRSSSSTSTKDGTAADHVSRDSDDPAERELLWAHLGGGGGNFGIVTRFWFRELPQAPAEAHSSRHAWNWSTTTGAVRGARHASTALLRANSDPGSPYAGLFALLHLTHKRRVADRADRPVRRRRTAASREIRARVRCRVPAADGARGAGGLPLWPRPMTRSPSACPGCSPPSGSTAPGSDSAANTSPPT